MTKEITEQELPDFIVDFIADFINKKLLFCGLSNKENSQKILHYGYIAESFCLALQKFLISELKKERPTVLTANPLPEPIIDINKNIIYMYSAKFEIEDIDDVYSFLNEFSEKFISFLSKRNRTYDV